MSIAIDPQAIESRLLRAIAEFGPEPDQVTRTATLEALDIDSLDLVELAQIAEEEFGVQIAADEVKDLTTVGEAIDLVIAKAT